jgi:hypothetical protein
MKYLYDVIHNEEYGHLGLKIECIPNAEAHGVLTAIHDLFEHFPGMSDTDGEAMALGAMLYCRGEGGFFDRSIPDTISGDLANLFIQSCEWGELTDPGRTMPIPDQVESWITSALVRAMRELRDEDHSFHSEWPHWVKGWLRKGYRKARARYTLDSLTISHVFRQMMGDMEKVFNQAEERDFIEVNFVRKTLEYNIRLIHQWDEDHPSYEPWEE